MQYGVSLNKVFTKNSDPTDYIHAIKHCCTSQDMTRASSVDNPILMLGTTLDKGTKRLCNSLFGSLALLSNILRPDKLFNHECSNYHVTQNSKMLPIVLNTGASFLITPELSDFVDDILPPPDDKIKGLKHSIGVTGIGWVEWTVYDLNGVVRVIRTKALYVPEATI